MCIYSYLFGRLSLTRDDSTPGRSSRAVRGHDRPPCHIPPPKPSGSVRIPCSPWRRIPLGFFLETHQRRQVLQTFRIPREGLDTEMWLDATLRSLDTEDFLAREVFLLIAHARTHAYTMERFFESCGQTNRHRAPCNLKGMRLCYRIVGIHSKSHIPSLVRRSSKMGVLWHRSLRNTDLPFAFPVLRMIRKSRFKGRFSAGEFVTFVTWKWPRVKAMVIDRSIFL